MTTSAPWFVYILECKNKTLYTGITTDLKRRFQEHLNRSAKYTSYNPPVKMVYSEEVLDRSQASKREAEIKGWKREKKLALILQSKKERPKSGLKNERGKA